MFNARALGQSAQAEQDTLILYSSQESVIPSAECPSVWCQDSTMPTPEERKQAFNNKCHSPWGTIITSHVW